MALYLELVAGMPIQVTHPIQAEKMVANGTMGTLETIIYHPATTFCVVHDNVADVTVRIPGRTPPGIIKKSIGGLDRHKLHSMKKRDVID
ncbi:hypothetical protein F442_13497 [Phytophthora nicotianae P10297]|uniref:Uncharacterized protein n=3 Tax=Phytophthora nicotianae TaxID=4792 RepID=V9EPB6_PHYNI|nr:hypothetical protein F443_13638 [Phytophthora nicotianae P1569]ETO69763.1 hypothetical protein F444_13699 [Phytophthora nicotianae P1976]ETP39013.1 hypothetical protein F442_13497 [Phytophthora nicotianae P10297]